ncbi:MAG TPA: hypothetical protein VMA36_19545 [Candidatus Limnocylindria bacterium]|jgi:hypothetical protein|nr:hypothetical protein [Candidatus Limnocylindria bacterium]
MSGRIAALAIALATIALVLAQDLLPRTALYHTWQYALALAIALAVVLVYANAARRGEDGPGGKRLAIAMLGAAVVGIAGLASGLLGPDTAEIVGAPGTVTPVPALGAAAFFGSVEADTLAAGSGGIALRRRNGPEIALGTGSRTVLGESLVYLEQRPAAYIDAYDAHGAHLTITQPTNPSFLSPVLLFRDTQRIGAISVPLDTFATPAQHRMLRALYFTPQQLAQFSHGAVTDGRAGLVITADDDAGHPLGITLAPSGRDVTIGGIRVHATLGTYPALAIAAAPPTWALVLGIALFLFGVVWSSIGKPGAAPVVSGPAPSAS